jgi:hypothetical protein
MTGLDDQDRELDDFLARRSVLHRRMADRDYHEPSHELDRLVLDKAREAIEVRASAPVYRAPRWALPVALAASVVLALAVVLNIARLHGAGGYPVPAPASPAGEAAPGFVADTKTVPMAPPRPEAQLAESSSQAPAPELRSDSTYAASPPMGAANDPVVITEAKRTSAEADHAHDVRLASNAAGFPPPSAAVADTKPTSQPLNAAVADAKPAASQPAGAARVGSGVQMPAEVHAASDASALASAAASAQRTSPPSAASSARFARAEAASEGRVVPAREIALRTAEPEAPEAHAVVRREHKDASETGAASPTLSDKAQHTDPQVWMREIEQLRRGGKSADADREITAFRKAYPTLPISPKALGRDPRPAK